MNNLIQNIETIFTNLEIWGSNLPTYILLPLIMILATIGTIILVTVILGIIRLLIGKDNMQKFMNFFTVKAHNIGNNTNDFMNSSENSK